MNLTFSRKEFLAGQYVVIYHGIEKWLINIGSVVWCGDGTKGLTPFGHKKFKRFFSD